MKHIKKYPSRAKLMQLFHYDEFGQLTWLSGQRTGKVAGTLRKKDQRIQVNIKGSFYELQRLIWIWNKGDIPNGFIIDHIDQNPLNNKVDNLRIASTSQNNMNRRANKNSTSSYIGVSFRTAGSKWYAQIKYKGKVYALGLHVSEVEAAKARDVKSKELFGEFANLNFPEGDEC